MGSLLLWVALVGAAGAAKPLNRIRPEHRASERPHPTPRATPDQIRGRLFSRKGARSEQQAAHLAAIRPDQLRIIDDAERIDQRLARQAVGEVAVAAKHLEELFERGLR